MSFGTVNTKPWINHSTYFPARPYDAIRVIERMFHYQKHDELRKYLPEYIDNASVSTVSRIFYLSVIYQEFTYADMCAPRVPELSVTTDHLLYPPVHDQHRYSVLNILNNPNCAVGFAKALNMSCYLPNSLYVLPPLCHTCNAIISSPSGDPVQHCSSLPDSLSSSNSDSSSLDYQVNREKVEEGKEVEVTGLRTALISQVIEWILRYTHVIDTGGALTIPSTLNHNACALHATGGEVECISPNPLTYSIPPCETRQPLALHLSIITLALLSNKHRHIPHYMYFPLISLLIPHLTNAHNTLLSTAIERKDEMEAVVGVGVSRREWLESFCAIDPVNIKKQIHGKTAERTIVQTTTGKRVLIESAAGLLFFDMDKHYHLLNELIDMAMAGLVEETPLVSCLHVPLVARIVDIPHHFSPQALSLYASFDLSFLTSYSCDKLVHDSFLNLDALVGLAVSIFDPKLDRVTMDPLGIDISRVFMFFFLKVSGYLNVYNEVKLRVTQAKDVANTSSGSDDALLPSSSSDYVHYSEDMDDADKQAYYSRSIDKIILDLNQTVPNFIMTHMYWYNLWAKEEERWISHRLDKLSKTLKKPECIEKTLSETTSKGPGLPPRTNSKIFSPQSRSLSHSHSHSVSGSASESVRLASSPVNTVNRQSTEKSVEKSDHTDGECPISFAVDSSHNIYTSHIITTANVVSDGAGSTEEGFDICVKQSRANSSDIMLIKPFCSDDGAEKKSEKAELAASLASICTDSSSIASLSINNNLGLRVRRHSLLTTANTFSNTHSDPSTVMSGVGDGLVIRPLSISGAGTGDYLHTIGRIGGGVDSVGVDVTNSSYMSNIYDLLGPNYQQIKINDDMPYICVCHDKRHSSSFNPRTDASVNTSLFSYPAPIRTPSPSSAASGSNPAAQVIAYPDAAACYLHNRLLHQTASLVIMYNDNHNFPRQIPSIFNFLPISYISHIVKKLNPHEHHLTSSTIPVHGNETAAQLVLNGDLVLPNALVQKHMESPLQAITKLSVYLSLFPDSNYLRNVVFQVLSLYPYIEQIRVLLRSTNHDLCEFNLLKRWTNAVTRQRWRHFVFDSLMRIKHCWSLVPEFTSSIIDACQSALYNAPIDSLLLINYSKLSVNNMIYLLSTYQSTATYHNVVRHLPKGSDLLSIAYMNVILANGMGNNICADCAKVGHKRCKACLASSVSARDVQLECINRDANVLIVRDRYNFTVLHSIFMTDRGVWYNEYNPYTFKNELGETVTCGCESICTCLLSCTCSQAGSDMPTHFDACPCIVLLNSSVCAFSEQGYSICPLKPLRSASSPTNANTLVNTHEIGAAPNKTHPDYHVARTTLLSPHSSTSTSTSASTSASAAKTSSQSLIPLISSISLAALPNDDDSNDCFFLKSGMECTCGKGNRVGSDLRVTTEYVREHHGVSNYVRLGLTRAIEDIRNYFELDKSDVFTEDISVLYRMDDDYFEELDRLKELEKTN